MRLGLWIGAITLFIVLNIYTDWKYVYMLMRYYDPRYVRMAGVAIAGILFYYAFVRFPTYMWIFLIRVMGWIQKLPSGGGSGHYRSGGMSGSGGGSSSSLKRETGMREFSDSARRHDPHFDSFKSDSGSSIMPSSSSLLSAQPHEATSSASQLTGQLAHAFKRMTESARIPTGKRSVSDSKKKFVAAQQSWKCHACRQTLPAWFEVDHVLRVEHGGSNHVTNLVALCRECHGKKTALEIL